MITVSTSQAPASSGARGYHHGDLRQALVSAGLRALETTDIADISLRALAREAGVSATAVYRHFPDKRALLVALAAEGLERLGHFQHSAAQQAGGDVGGRSAFAATGRAYVRFALANPALFRLTFTHCATRDDGVPDGGLAARMLQGSAAAIAGGDPETARRIAIQAWALVHGLAMLMLDGQLPTDDALIDRVIDSATLWRVG